MKAFVLERTGDPNDVLAVRELPKPKGSCCDRFDGSTLECNSAVEQALSKTSLVELVRLGRALQVPHLARASFF